MKGWIPSKLITAWVVAAIFMAGALSLVVMPAPAQAETLDTLLPYVIENHDRVRASKARLTAARNRAREALGAWYPTLSQTANAGHETQENDNGDDTRTGFNEWDISLTQLLWDFGSTNAAIDKARLQVEEARYNLIEARQSLILEAITAYLNVIRSNAALKFASDSEDNIRRQTGLEEALVGLGSGFSTDVLQAKTQLAGAQARRAQSEGGLTNALNRFQAVYGRKPDNLEALEPVPFPAPYLPQSLTQATDIALEANPSLKNAILAADIAMEDVRIARADNFAPKIEASGERKFKKNVGGTIGAEQETLAKVEMTFDFNLGFTAVNTLKASESDLSATTFTAADTRRNIEEQVRNAWQQLDTAKQTASHLNNQANIAAAFLELARNERQLGRRSLIDVLSGETNLINAKSDAFSAETDVLIAAYGLLAATGQLEYDVIKNSKGVEAPKTPLPSSAPAAETPDPAPVTPVTPADGQQNGDIEPDVTVAGGRSLKDMRDMFEKIEHPDVNRLPDTVVAYGGSQSSPRTLPVSRPPKPKSRYGSFDDFDTQAGPYLETPEPADIEFASNAGAASQAPDSGNSLPADSDTVTDDEAAAPPKDDARGSDELASLPDADAVPETKSDTSVFSFTKLFDFFTKAARKAAAPEKKVTVASVSMDMPPAVIPSPDTEIEVSAAPEPQAKAETPQTPGDDPISKLIGNVVGFFERAQHPAAADSDTPGGYDPVDVAENTTAEPPAPAPAVDPVSSPAAEMDGDDDTVETASLPQPSAQSSEPGTDAAVSDLPAKSFSLMDVFDFLRTGHQRAIAEKNHKKTRHRTSDENISGKTAETGPSQDTDRQGAEGTQAAKSAAAKPSLLSLIGDLFNSDDILKDLEYEPVTPETGISHERG